MSLIKTVPRFGTATLGFCQVWCRLLAAVEAEIITEQL